MTCDCLQRVQYKAKALAGEARRESWKQQRHVEAFQQGIRSGAEEIAARHLFRAGVYQATRSCNLQRGPSLPEIQDAVEELIGHEAADLALIRLRLEGNAIDFEVMEEPSRMVRNIVRQEEKRRQSLLMAEVVKELKASRDALKRADQLSHRLAIWEAGAMTPQLPEVICISDQHGQDLNNR